MQVRNTRGETETSFHAIQMWLSLYCTQKVQLGDKRTRGPAWRNIPLRRADEAVLQCEEVETRLRRSPCSVLVSRRIVEGIHLFLDDDQWRNPVGSRDRLDDSAGLKARQFRRDLLTEKKRNAAQLGTHRAHTWSTHHFMHKTAHTTQFTGEQVVEFRRRVGRKIILDVDLSTRHRRIDDVDGQSPDGIMSQKRAAIGSYIKSNGSSATAI
uniref:Uncharacterized protein n=1 Tax=Rhipicephalus microplus TaxID=6941 RepID=A0A6G5AGG9_RHIMP